MSFGACGARSFANQKKLANSQLSRISELRAPTWRALASGRALATGRALADTAGKLQDLFCARHVSAKRAPTDELRQLEELELERQAAEAAIKNEFAVRRDLEVVLAAAAEAALFACTDT